MPLVEFNATPSQIQLRRFASIGLPLAFGLAALLAWRREFPGVASVLACVAAVCFVLGWLRPVWFRPLYIVSMALGYPFAWLLGYLLLAGVYYLLIAPIGLILRLFRRDPLARDFDREAQSYWVARGESPDRDRYFRQY